MRLDLAEKNGVSILILSGQLAAGADDQLRQAIATLIKSGRTWILLDLTDVPYIDSSGIGELVDSYRMVRDLGGALKILKPGKKIRDSLELTKLLPIFEVFEDQPTAIASYASAG